MASELDNSLRVEARGAKAAVSTAPSEVAPNTVGNAVVLGASGFVGTHLVGRLASQESARVVALDVAPPRSRVASVAYAEVDVREKIETSWADGADVLFNLAAVHRTPGHSEHEYFETNVAGALNTVALAEAACVETIVFTSSISVYGPSEERLNEASPLRPTSGYGRSKKLAEEIHRAWAARGPGRRLIIVRPGVIFGPGEMGNYTQLARALRGGYFFYPGRRDTVKCGGYVDELIGSIEFALARPEREITYNFAYPLPATTEEIVRAFGEVAGYSARRATLPLPLLTAAAGLLRAASLVGAHGWIHPERVLKLVRSTNIEPRWLMDAGYEFETDLVSALERWRDESEGRFE